MNKETQDKLDQLLKDSSATDSFLNDDWMTSDKDPDAISTRVMVIRMIAEGLEKTDYELVLRKKE